MRRRYRLSLVIALVLVSATWAGAQWSQTGAWDTITQLLGKAHSWTGTQTFTTVDINGGAIDGATVGASSATTGVFTTVDTGQGANELYDMDQNVLTTSSPSFDTLSVTGGQITFPATQSAAAGANVLDDYEEGTFTPTFFDASSGGNEATYTAREGKYTKIGNVVYISCTIDIAAVDGLTGGNQAHIRGLPFTNRAIAGGYSLSMAVAPVGVTWTDYLSFVIVGATAYGSFYTFASAGSDTGLSVSNMGTDWFTFIGHYYIS